MRERRLLIVGLVGTVVAAVCCFTPILVIFVSAIGLTAIIGWLDFILFPALVGFAALTLFALWRSRRNKKDDIGGT